MIKRFKKSLFAFGTIAMVSTMMFVPFMTNSSSSVQETKDQTVTESSVGPNASTNAINQGRVEDIKVTEYDVSDGWYAPTISVLPKANQEAWNSINQGATPWELFVETTNTTNTYSYGYAKCNNPAIGNTAIDWYNAAVAGEYITCPTVPQYQANLDMGQVPGSQYSIRIATQMAGQDYAPQGSDKAADITIDGIPVENQPVLTVMNASTFQITYEYKKPVATWTTSTEPNGSGGGDWYNDGHNVYYGSANNMYLFAYNSNTSAYVPINGSATDYTPMTVTPSATDGSNTISISENANIIAGNYYSFIFSKTPELGAGNGPMNDGYNYYVETNSMMLSVEEGNVIFGPIDPAQILVNEATIQYSFTSTGPLYIFFKVYEQADPTNVIVDNQAIYQTDTGGQYINFAIHENLETGKLLRHNTTYVVEARVGSINSEVNNSITFTTDTALPSTPIYKDSDSSSANFEYTWNDKYEDDLYWRVLDGNGNPTGDESSLVATYGTHTFNTWESSGIAFEPNKYYYLEFSEMDNDWTDADADELLTPIFRTIYGVDSLVAENITTTSADIMYTVRNAYGDFNVYYNFYEATQAEVEGGTAGAPIEGTGIAESVGGKWVIPEDTLNPGRAYTLYVYAEPTKTSIPIVLEFSTNSTISNFNFVSASTSGATFSYTNGAFAHDVYVEVEEIDQSGNYTGIISYTAVWYAEANKTTTDLGYWTIPDDSLLHDTSYEIRVYSDPDHNDASLVTSLVFETLTALPQAPTINPPVGMNYAKFDYIWLDSKPDEIYYSIVETTSGTPVTLVESDSFDTGEANGTWKSPDILNSNSTYSFYFSSRNGDFLHGDSVIEADPADDEYVVSNVTTDSEMAIIELLVKTPYEASFSYINTSQSDANIYFNVYENDQLVKSDGVAVAKTEDGIWSTPVGALKVNSKYTFEFYENYYKDARSHIKTITFTTDNSYLVDGDGDGEIVEFSKITSNSVQVTYDWYYPNGLIDGVKPYYTLDDGDTWVEISPALTGDNPTANGTHSFSITGLSPNTTYEFSMKFIDDDYYDGDNLGIANPVNFGSFTTLWEISEAEIDLLDSTTMKLSFFWSPGVSSSDPVWLWVGNDRSIDPFKTDYNGSDEKYNNWVNLNSAQKVWEGSLYPAEYAEFTLSGLEEASEYRIILTTNIEDPKQEVDIIGDNEKSENGYFYTTGGSFAMTVILIITISILCVIILFMTVKPIRLKRKAKRNYKNIDRKYNTPIYRYDGKDEYQDPYFLT